MTQSLEHISTGSSTQVLECTHAPTHTHTRTHTLPGKSKQRNITHTLKLPDSVLNMCMTTTRVRADQKHYQCDRKVQFKKVFSVRFVIRSSIMHVYVISFFVYLLNCIINGERTVVLFCFLTLFL